VGGQAVRYVMCLVLQFWTYLIHIMLARLHHNWNGMSKSKGIRAFLPNPQHFPRDAFVGEEGRLQTIMYISAVA
jgi:hypothetical protein